MSLELEDAGFDFSVLSEFRVRLIENNKEAILLNKMLERFREKDWVKYTGLNDIPDRLKNAGCRKVNRNAMNTAV